MTCHTKHWYIVLQTMCVDWNPIRWKSRADILNEIIESRVEAKHIDIDGVTLMANWKVCIMKAFSYSISSTILKSLNERLKSKGLSKAGLWNQMTWCIIFCVTSQQMREPYSRWTPWDISTDSEMVYLKSRSASACTCRNPPHWVEESMLL